MEGWLYISEVEELESVVADTLLKRIQRKKYPPHKVRQVKARKGGGKGGMEYQLHISVLSIAAQERYWQKHRPVALPDTTEKETALADALAQSDNAKKRIGARLEILKLWEAFRMENDLAIHPSMGAFAHLYNTGGIQVHPDVREQFKGISKDSLDRWRKRLAVEGVTSLSGKYGNRKGSGIFDADSREVREFIEAMMTEYPHCLATHVMEGLEARYKGREGVRIPAVRTIQRYMKEWKANNAGTFEAHSNPDHWKSRRMAAFGSASEGIVRLNQLWEMDSSPNDVIFEDGRYALIFCIDIFSRRMRVLVSKTSRSTAIAALFRYCLLNWGVCEGVRTDQGADYTSNHLVWVFTNLEIKQILCPPFQPWKKPFIERGVQIFSHDCVELLPGFVGHNVAERKAIEGRRSFADRLMKKGKDPLEVSMTAEAFQKFADDWCENVYGRRVHSELGVSPFQKVAAWREPIRTISNERALDVLLSETDGDGHRTVTNKGIRIENAHFIAPELEAWIGERVHVRFDPSDLGRVFVFAGDPLQFVCVAECPERTGVSRQEVAKKATELQRTRIQEEKRQLKETAKKVGVQDIVEEILVSRGEEAAKVVMLPQEETEYETDALREAAKAVEELEAADALREAEEDEELAVMREQLRENEEESDFEEEPVDKYMRLRRKTNPTEMEKAWMRRFEGTPEGQGVLECLNLAAG